MTQRESKIMANKIFLASIATLSGICALTFYGAARAQTVTKDDFTQPNDTNPWTAFGGACLTAGDGTASTIPACVGSAGTPYYGSQIQYGGSGGYLGQTNAPSSRATEAPDPAGQGALRFTNGAPGGYGQAGSIISSGAPFGTSAGLQVVFKTVTYRGDSGGGGRDGADGMSFFLMDGAYPPYDTGAFGGSLGFTCSNTNNDGNTRADGTPRGYDGLAHGYLGLGIDEYGNFLNQADNTATGFGYVPGRIGLRGAGSISWAALNALNSIYYPSSLGASQRTDAVRNTCQTGFLWDYSRASRPRVSTTPVADYAPIYSTSGVGAYSILTGFKIANESAITRTDGTPITYNLKITQNGLLSMSYSLNGGNYVPVISKQDITSSNGALPGSFRFGFSGSTGGSNNVHEILCFQAAPADVASTSVGINEKEATKIESGTQAYLAYYYPSNWTGRLTASNLYYDSSTKNVLISSVANWDASCNLSGISAGAINACPTTGRVGPVAAQAPTNRTMLTWDGGQGVAFEWASGAGGSITSTQQSTLDLGDVPLPYTADRLNYLRGDRSNEITSLGVGKYRARESILSDIVNSSPTWAGPPTSPYAAVWSDLLVSSDPLPENSGTQTYTQYLATAQTRLNVVYNGANDGFLHGFRSGAFDSNNNYVNNSTFPNDGQEVLAYMPGAVLNTIHNSVDPTLDLSNASYGHNFYVDATPDVEELFYNGIWHSWLVAGLGAGGSAVYALDVTDPTQFSEANAKKLVIGEWTAANISCVNVANCGTNLGKTYGVPVIRRLHNGKWAIIFGNGYASATGDAGIFIMTINSADGTIGSTYYLSTGASGTNGIAYPSPSDRDGDHITDYVYAGDLHGNVWRFDLTSPLESAWAVSTTPVFTVPSGKPITTKLIVSNSTPTSGLPRVILDFGTGRKQPQTNAAPVVYEPGPHYLYGIWDWDTANWNSKSALQVASLSGPQTINDSTLQAQTLTVNASTGNLDITSNPVCYAGSTTCAGGASKNTQFGFEVRLTGLNEQILFSPLLFRKGLFVNTTVPAVNSPTDCNINHDTGNTLGVSFDTGAAIPGLFPNAASTDAQIAGSQTNATGTPFVVLVAADSFLVTQSLGDGKVSGALACPKGQLFCSGKITLPGGGGPGTNSNGKRITWVERR